MALGGQPWAYGAASGSSFASAFVTATVALLREQQPEFSVEEIRLRLRNSAQQQLLDMAAALR